ncbi:MAG: hypothetical protein ABW184_12840 [Sphingobium sp.]
MASRTAWAAVLLLWLICAAAMLRGWPGLSVPAEFADPDDALRLVQVRDWMAGQSWFDVTQYRSHPPRGASMHWSRLVDVPIAALILLGRLVVPADMAEHLALVAVPLLTLLALCIAVHKLAVAASGRRIVGVVAVALLSLSFGVLAQFRPVRIDHHGWQIVLGTFSVLALLPAVGGSVRHAAMAGAVTALSLSVAIEGLPLAAAMGGVLGVQHLRGRSSGQALLAYLAVLTCASALSMLAMLGWPGATRIWCDALSPAYLLPFVAATGTLAVLLRVVPQDRTGRAVTLLAVAGAALLCLRLAAPQCLAGPFASLDPLVARLWYRNVAEGLPIWTQPLGMRLLLPLPPLIGMAGALWAVRVDAARRETWLALLALQCVTALVSLLVMRAMGIAHVLALPASAWLFVRMLVATRRLAHPAARIAAGVACFLVTPIGAQALVAATLPDSPVPDGKPSACTTHMALRGLNALPAATLFSPLDIAPHLLVHTRHGIVGSGHHRSREGMKAVIAAFVAPPDRARAIVTGTGATYLVLCPNEADVARYAAFDRRSLAAVLQAGRIPDWLEPVAMRSGETIRVYRIVQLPTKRIATPFIQ